jgi:hypothetical protein
VLPSSDDTSDPLSFSFASEIVEFVVFTTDLAFLQTLREAVGDARRLWHVPSADKVGDLLVAGEVGILVLDVQSEADAARRFVAQIKRQFPDLVVVAAGNREAEAALARLISEGIVYRFMHKPMSRARAKMFADAAVKRYETHRERARVAPPARLFDKRRRRLIVLLLLGVVAAAIIAALMTLSTHAL